MYSDTQENKKMRQVGHGVLIISTKALNLIMLGLSGKQWMANFIICLLLIPTVSTPARGSYVVRTNNDTKNFEPVNEDLWFWDSAIVGLNAKIEKWTTPRREVNVLHDESDKDKAGGDDDKTKKSDNDKTKGTKRKGKKGGESASKKTSENEKDRESTTSEAIVSEEKKAESATENKGKTELSAESSIEYKKDLPIASKENKLNNSSASSAFFVNQIPVDEQESVYSAENNLGSPFGQVEKDSSNQAAVGRIRHRAGIANFSFGISLAGLSGRGIDAGIGMTYNSRTWNKSSNSSNQDHFTYDVDESWIAPGFSTGFGYLETEAILRNVVTNAPNNDWHTEITPLGLNSPDGTRSHLPCKTLVPIPGTNQQRCSLYSTTDGSFIEFVAKTYVDNPNNSTTPYTANYDQASFTTTYPGGTKIWYSGGFGSGVRRKHYPLIIQDSNGNRIRIAYKADQSGRIDYITDTLNRKIKFYYGTDSSGNSDKLVAVTIPGMGANDEIQTVRFYYENLTLNSGGFISTAQVTAPTSPIQVLKYVYMPSTKSGYKYEYHSYYGMIKKIKRFTGMTVSNATNTSTTGTVTTEGTEAASTTYNFPDGTTALTDVPKYNMRTDDWAGKTSTTPAETSYHAPEPTGYNDRISEITVKGVGFDIVTETISHNTAGWDNGLIKETSVKKKVGPSQYTQLMSKTVYHWQQSPYSSIGRRSPQLQKVEITNDSGLTKTIEYEYDQYNNQTKIKEYDYGNQSSATLLRTTEIGYEDGTGWKNKNISGLVKSVKRIVGSTTVAKTEYVYDSATMTPRNDIDTSTHDTYYNPAHPAWTEEICPDGNPSAQSALPNGCIIINHPGYDANSIYRGNVTKVTNFADATLSTDPNADVTNVKYDITGNVVESSLSCCQVRTYNYDKANEYAFQISQTSGSSPTQLTTSATYNRNTGLMLTSTDENNQITNYEYETDTLRQKKTTYPNGGYVQTEYSDKLAPGSMPGFVRTTTTLESNKTVQSYSYFNGSGAGIRSASETPDGWSISAAEFDHLGRPIKSYNPFYASTPNGAIPANTKFTEVTNYDALGRTTSVKLQDNTTVSTEYSNSSSTPSGFNKTFVTVTDQAGKQRRQVADALGRVVRVDEPDSNGILGAVDAPTQPTSYEYDANDNLSKVIQTDGTVTQERLFKYDSLSRLTHEKQVEANATLDNNGVKVTSGGLWTKVLKYNADGLLTEGTDARGVKTTFAYDGLNRVSSVAYTDGTPTVTYTYDQERIGFFNKGALTRVETADGGTPRPDTPSTVTEFDYDKMGSVVKHRNSIGTQTFVMEYIYDLAGQLTKEKYPSGREINIASDVKGRLASVTDASRTYANGFQYETNGGFLNSYSFGNGTTQNFTYNDRLQMNSQELKRGSEVLQKYDYGFGQIDSSGNLDTTKNNGQLAKIESYIGTNKQWTQKFKYDSIGRLSEAEEKRGDTNALSYKQKFDYDRFGNLYRKQANNPSGQETPLPTTWIEDADINKATNSLVTNTTYDDAGNVIQDTKFRSQNFSYDANGRMYQTAHTNNINNSNSVYDSAGQRVATKVDGIWTFFIYDAFGNKVAEYGGLNSTDEGGVKYILQDWQGSSRAIVGQNGYVQSRMDYSTFGEEITSGIGQRTTANGFGTSSAFDNKYALTERDKATGLDHTIWRKLENQAGRWTSPDPYNGSASIDNPQSFNRYSYTQNEPTNFIDPSGLLRIWSCTRNWFDLGEGNRIFGEWTCQLIYDDGGGWDSGRRGPGEVGGAGGAGGDSSESPDPCRGILDQLKKALRNVAKRARELQQDFLDLVPRGIITNRDLENYISNMNDARDPSRIRRQGSVESHENSFRQAQRNLRKKINNFNNNDCGDKGYKLPKRASAISRANVPGRTRPLPNGSLFSKEALAAIAVAGVVIYWIVSEGSRIVFPPRNLVPVP